MKSYFQNHQDFAERMRDKVPGRPVPSKSQWKKLARDVGAPLNPTRSKARP
jgi:hypothetical protein